MNIIEANYNNMDETIITPEITTEATPIATEETITPTEETVIIPETEVAPEAPVVEEVKVD